jgi:hypothetical protein
MKWVAVLAIATATWLAAAGATSRQTTSSISGIVVDGATSRPIADAIVRANFAPAPEPGDRRLQLPDALTGADGRFVLPEVLPGGYDLQATKSGHAIGALGSQRPGGESQLLMVAEGQRVAGVVLRLWKLGVISGTVLDEAGEPVVNVRVRAWRATFSRGRRRLSHAGEGRTDDRGLYRIAELGSGDYVVATSIGRTAMPAAAVTTTSGFDSHSSPKPADGTALLLGNTIYPMGMGGPVPPPLSDGRLSIYPTTYHPSSTSLAQTTGVRLNAGEDRQGVDIQIHPVRTARVEGTVTGSSGARQGLLVRLESSHDRSQYSADFDEDALQATTDAAGVFRFPAVPAGQYFLRAGGTPPAAQYSRADPHEWCSVPLKVADGDIIGMPLVLQQGLHIRGRIEFEGTADVTIPEVVGIRIEIAAADANAFAILPDPPALVDAKSQFVSVGLPSGRYVVRAGNAPRGWMFKSVTFEQRDASDTPLELDRKDVNVVVTFIDRVTTLSGVVRTAYGATDNTAAVLVFPANDPAWSAPGFNPHRFRRVRTTDGGAYVIDALPTGDYYVVAVPDDRAEGWQDPSMLELLARSAALVNIRDGDRKIQDLRTEERR